MRLRILINNIFLIYLITICNPSFLGAKCRIDIYIIESKVAYKTCCDCDEMYPIENAQIAAFFDDDEIGEVAYSNKFGEFHLNYFYNTYKGTWIIIADRCGKKPKKLTLIVMAEGFYTLKKQIKVKKPIIKDGKKIFEIPPIILRKIPKEASDYRDELLKE